MKGLRSLVESSDFNRIEVAPERGLEPLTRRLTAGCSTIELLWNSEGTKEYRYPLIASTDFVILFPRNACIPPRKSNPPATETTAVGGRQPNVT